MLVRWPVVALASLVVAVGAGGAFALGWTQPIDAAVDDATRAPAATFAPLARALDFVGSLEAVLLLVTLLVGALLLERRPREAALVLAVFVVAEALVAGLKVAFDRARPEDGLVATASASFPSGHAMRGALLALLLAWWLAARLAHAPRRRRAALAALAAWGIAMGAARVLLHVHWASDVVTGAALGLGVGALGLALAPVHRREATVRVPVAVPVTPTDAPETPVPTTRPPR